MKLVALSTVFLIVTAAQGLGADFDFSVWSGSGRPSQNTIANSLTAGAALLAEANGQNDTACANDFVLDGQVSVDPSLPASVSSQADWLRVVEDKRFSIYVVRNILWCGGPASGGVFAGCARKGGPIAIAEDFFTPVVVAHEIGHAQGNLHNSSEGFLMFPRAKNTNTRVTQSECDNYLVGKLFPAVPDDFPYQQEDENAPMAAVVDAVADLDELLSSVWHSPPADVIAMLTEEDIQTIRDLVAGEPNSKWPNALTILGIRGEADDFVLLEDAIHRATEALISGTSDAPLLTIRANAAIALGVLYNRTQEVALLDSLRKLMTAPQAEFPELNLPAEELEDLVKTAAMGFAHAGPTATLTFPAALAQAEIGNLQISGVFSADGPIVASLPNQRETVEDPSTNPSLAIVAEGPEQGRASSEIGSIASFYEMIGDIQSQVDTHGLDAYITGASSGSDVLSQ